LKDYLLTLPGKHIFLLGHLVHSNLPTSGLYVLNPHIWQPLIVLAAFLLLNVAAGQFLQDEST